MNHEDIAGILEKQYAAMTAADRAGNHELAEAYGELMERNWCILLDDIEKEEHDVH